MKKISTIILFFSFYLNANLVAQTTDSDFFLNIFSPINLSIPSSEIGGADWGGSFDNALVGELEPAINIDGTDTLACEQVNDLTGKIALIDRGECEFGTKALTAEVSGAIAVVFCSNLDEVTDMGEGVEGSLVNIPVILLRSSHCDIIKFHLSNDEDFLIGISEEASALALIVGNIAHDENLNCSIDAGENSLAGFQVNATSTNSINTTYSDLDGNYYFYLDTGTYEIQLFPPQDIWESCNDPIDVTLANYEDEATVDLPAVAVVDCALLTVDLASPRLRRCFENFYVVNYCNIGTDSAQDAFVVIELSPFFTVLSSTLPYDEDNGILIFELGDLESGACGQFSYVAELSCDAELGMTVCTEANIFPVDRSCLIFPANWDGSEVFVEGLCNTDEVEFTIHNLGENDMSTSQLYTLLREGKTFESGNFLLATGESRTFSFPADGATYRMEANQTDAHPWNNMPSATVEACSQNGEFSTGFHGQFPVADYGENYDELCQEVIGSFDPNDKQGFPFGYGDEHYINRGVDLSYLIRFQNTGTDTAFKVVVTDEISEHLDMRTFIPGASSHAYTLDITDNILRFTFDNIMLPDSFVNEPASNGWFEYKIAQKINLPLETVVENNAAIYFDFNEPIITNTTLHTVGENFLPTNTKETLIAGNTLQLRPNPISSNRYLYLDDLQGNSLIYTVYNIQGQEVLVGQLGASRIKIPENFQTGIYILKTTDTEGRIQTGRLVIQ